MEYEISDRPDNIADDESDGELIKGHIAPRKPVYLSPEDYFDKADCALHIPEEGD
ncbi:hypothetical protein V5740_04735 [Croceibacterium sp. TMG7-5b_MA50]|uniref:hypothetical protein n=1 Tax=Croceibacterium sp. TMG7-5b_MA50 TaxID=3121290 RepID=UPI0032214854